MVHSKVTINVSGKNNSQGSKQERTLKCNVVLREKKKSQNEGTLLSSLGNEPGNKGSR